MKPKFVILLFVVYFLGIFTGGVIEVAHEKTDSNPEVKISQPESNQKETDTVAENSTEQNGPNSWDAPINKYGFPVIPTGPAKKYMEDAEEYLSSCFGSPSEKRNCQNHQARFEQEYVNALAGDYLAQSNVAFNLWRAGPGILPDNKIQACAWRLVIMTSGSKYLSDRDMEVSRMICDGIDKNDPTVIGRAMKIRNIINTHKIKPVAVPEIDYDPHRDKNETSSGG